MAEETNKKTPRDLLRVVFRRRWLFLLSASLFATVVLQGAQLWPLKYTGSAKFQRSFDPASEEGMGRGSGSFESIKRTLELELAGREAITQVAEELGLTDGLPRDANAELTTVGRIQKQQLVRELQQTVKVRWDVKSREVDLVTVSVEHEDPDTAQRIPGALIDRYKTLTSKAIAGKLTVSLGFLKSEVSARETKLTEVRRKRFAFEIEHAEDLPDRPAELKENLLAVERELSDRRREQTIARETIARLSDPDGPKATTTTSATQPAEKPIQTKVGWNPEYLRLKDELRDYERRLDVAKSLSHMTDAHPTIKTLNAKIAELKGRLESTDEKIVLEEVYGSTGTGGDRAPGGALAAAKSTAQVTTREIERLEARRQVLRRLVNSSAPVRQQYLEIVRQIEREEEDLQSWQKRLTEVQMALSGEVAERRTLFQTAQSAEKQLLPSSPKLTMILGIAIFGGLALGGGLVFLFNMLDRSIARTEDAVECFNLPVLGTVGEIVTGRQLRWGRLKRWIVTPVVTTIVLAALSLSSCGVWLRLKSPDQYAQWQSSPGVFLQQKADRTIKWVTQTIKIGA